MADFAIVDCHAHIFRPWPARRASRPPTTISSTSSAPCTFMATSPTGASAITRA